MAWLVFGCSTPAFSADETAAGPALSQLQLAPIGIRPRLGGNIDYIQRQDTVAGRKTRSQALNLAVNAGVDLNSFIWQPWFAQVNGGLGVSTYMTDTGTTTGSTSSSSKNMSSVITGKVALDVLPLSRFPFSANYQKDDNRQNIGYGSANSASQSTRFGLSQRYRPLRGNSNYSANYNQSRWESALSGVSRQRQMGIEMGTVLSPNQNLSITGSKNLNEYSGTGQSTLSNTMVAHHSYRPAADVNIENMANAGNTTYHLTAGDNEEKYVQVSNYSTWNSRERPLTVSGGLRLSGVSNSTPAGSARQSSANANLGASYQLTERVRTHGNANVNLNDDKQSGTQTVSSSESGGAEYRSEQIDLGAFRYGTHASGSVSNNNSAFGNTQGLGLSAGHFLTRFSTESSSVLMETHVDQTVSMNKFTNNPSSRLLSHSGSLGWTIAGVAGKTVFRINASDSRSMNAPRSFFQLVNLQATRTEYMSRNTSLDGNLTIQSSRQGTSGTPGTPATVTSSASVNYARQRVFSIPRLNFRSEVRVYSDSLVPLSPGPQEQASRSWGNHLGYSIGQLNLMGDASVSESGHIRQSTLMFRLSRTF